MKLPFSLSLPMGNSIAKQGSVLIIVLWITFGLVSLALYFAQSMFFEFRAADNHVASVEAEQAIEGASRYISYVLGNTNLVEPGLMPDLQVYDREEVFLGDATFWLIGRSEQESRTEVPTFALVDESSKLNLNTATVEMLQMLPGMTPQFAAAIIDWRDEDSDVTTNGAESESYQRRNPSPYSCKNARFETVEELRFVFGADPGALYGEDYNRNGILDLNENDADVSPPIDNRDGRLDPGILECVTVYSLEPNIRGDGSPRIVIGGTNAVAQLTQLLQERLGEARANELQGQVTTAAANARSLLEFYFRIGNQMSTAEFALIEGDLSVTNAPFVEGLINVNSASAAVLACVPGIGAEKAQQLANSRPTPSAADLPTIAWVTQVLDEQSIVQAGPYLTSRSYQFTADIAAVGRYGRGYRRTQFVFDTSEQKPKIIYRRDLSRLGWAMGQQARERLSVLAENPRLQRSRRL